MECVKRVLRGGGGPQTGAWQAGGQPGVTGPACTGCTVQALHRLRRVDRLHRLDRLRRSAWHTSVILFRGILSITRLHAERRARCLSEWPEGAHVVPPPWRYYTPAGTASCLVPRVALPRASGSTGTSPGHVAGPRVARRRGRVARLELAPAVPARPKEGRCPWQGGRNLDDRRVMELLSTGDGSLIIDWLSTGDRRLIDGFTGGAIDG